MTRAGSPGQTPRLPHADRVQLSHAGLERVAVVRRDGLEHGVTLESLESVHAVDRWICCQGRSRGDRQVGPPRHQNTRPARGRRGRRTLADPPAGPKTLLRVAQRQNRAAHRVGSAHLAASANRRSARHKIISDTTRVNGDFRCLPSTHFARPAVTHKSASTKQASGTGFAPAWHVRSAATRTTTIQRSGAETSAENAPSTESASSASRSLSPSAKSRSSRLRTRPSEQIACTAIFATAAPQLAIRRLRSMRSRVPR